MKALLQPVREYVAELWTGLVHGWNRFWFTPADPTTLAAVRICTGIVLLYIHLTCLNQVLNFIGPDGWIDSQAAEELRVVNNDFPTFQERWIYGWWVQSLWFYIQSPTGIWISFSVFIVALLCFTLGLFTRTATVLVWIGHISYIQRGYVTWYGVDTFLAMLLLYLMFGPSGATLSLDRLAERYRAARRALARGRTPSADELALAPRWSANVVIRMIQVHMCIAYLCAGLAKLQGPSWWQGTSVWMTMVVPEFAILDMSWLANFPDWVWQTVSAGGSFMTIAFEISFSFLIWNRTLRPLVLFIAVMMHAGIGVFMGLGTFSAIMLTGCLAFVPPAGLRWLVQTLCQGVKGYRFVYDHHDKAQVRAAAWVAAADPWRQVEICNSHEKGAPAAAGSLVTPNGTVLHGFEAFTRLARSLRVFWLVGPVALWSFTQATRRPEMATAGAKS